MKNKYLYDIRITSDFELVDMDAVFDDFSLRIAAGTDFKLLNSQIIQAPKVSYPEGGARNIDNIEITFTNPQNISKDRVESALRYWSSIPFVGKVVGSFNWLHGVLNFKFDATQSASKDINKRNILEFLLDLIENGSQQKLDGGQAVKGLGADSVERIIGCTGYLF